MHGNELSNKVHIATITSLEESTLLSSLITKIRCWVGLNDIIVCIIRSLYSKYFKGE